MKKMFVILLVLTAFIYSPAPANADMLLTAGKSASLGVEATTAFGWDVNNNATGLETKAGMELIFPLFPAENRGIYPENTESPAVRLALNNAAFSWWNAFYTAGGNYEQDNFNKWTARPLILTFDSFLADVVWKNYFFRVASSTTDMWTNMITARSIFDDVMDAGDRYYYLRQLALWFNERYNIQNFPLLKSRLNRNMVNVDYRGDVSGILAGGGEWERFSFTLKAASRYRARAATEAVSNVNNAWLLGADFEIVPLERFKIDATTFAGFNYDKVTTSTLNKNKNPVSAGLTGEYQIPLSDEIILAPYAGFDLMYETVTEKTFWEMGAGLFLFTRGYDARSSSRMLDYDNVIPAGASIGMNINQDKCMNMIFSWFDPAGRDSLIENFGGFLQFELSNLLNADNDTLDYAALGQLEYSINGKITPYIRTGYGPQFNNNGIKIPYTGIIKAAAGCYLTLIHFFSIDLRYEMNHMQTNTDLDFDNGLFSAVFTIRM